MISELAEISKTLFHGSPYVFKEFKNRPTFFSETPQFAVGYADQKSFEGAMDASAQLYQVKVQTKIFDIRNQEDYDAMYKVLPDTVEFAYNNFGFTTKQPKDVVIQLMTGNDVIKPSEDAIKANVGDKIVDPTYDKETYTIIAKDSDNAYGVKTRRIYKILEDIHKDPYDIHFDGKYVKLFNPVRDFLKKIYERDWPGEYYNNWAKHTLLLHFMGQKTYAVAPDEWKTTPEDHKEFKRIYEECRKNMIQAFIANEDYTEFNLKPKPVQLKDTWRFYENEDVYNALLKLGCGGYVAKEDGHNTYCIFNPKDDVQITEYIINGNRYSTWEDYQAFRAYDKKIATTIYAAAKEIFGDDYQSFKVDLSTWDIERAYEQKIPANEFIQQHIEKMKQKAAIKNEIASILMEVYNYETDELKLPKTHLDGVFYHGTSTDESSVFNNHDPDYSDWGAVWFAPQKNAAIKFSDQYDGKVKILFVVRLKSDDIADISYGTGKELIEFLGFHDLREAIPFLKQNGFNGWVTSGSIGDTIYTDVAIFDTDIIDIVGCQLSLNNGETWTKTMSVNDANEFLATR